MQWKSRKFPLLLAIIQLALIVVFALLVEYSDEAGPPKLQNYFDTSPSNSLPKYYPMFQDVHVMIFIGFGFLMTFLKKYGFSAVGLNFLLGSMCIQMAIIMQGVWNIEDGKIRISILNLVTADVAAAAVLISFGALLGKTNALQLIIMAVVEIAIFACNEHLGVSVFMTADVGGSIFVHTFGAYFGLAVSFAMYRKDFEGNIKESSMYHSDLFSMIGTVFLWIFWPSFNAVLADGNDQHRAVINTLMSLVGSVVVTFVISSALEKEGHIDMVHVQNATLAGGVAIGTGANMMMHPYGALTVGCLAGCISTFGYHYLTPFMSRRLNTHDTCGVNNLHGMPGVIAGIISTVVSALATEEIYGESLYSVFPGMVPAANTTAYEKFTKTHPGIEPGLGFTAKDQALSQIKALLCTLAISLTSGFVTGIVLRQPMFDPPDKNQLYDDTDYWTVPEDIHS